jgi:hypothetical protein
MSGASDRYFVRLPLFQHWRAARIARAGRLDHLGGEHLRKYLVAAVAATAALGAGTAAAQTAGPTMSAKLKPAKAGTKKKPQNVSLHTVVSTTDQNHTVGKIEIQMPKTFQVSGKGFKTCSANKIVATTGAGCPKGSKVGGGTADAIAGIGQSTKVPVSFKVTAFVTGKTKMAFLLQAQGALKNVYLAPAKLKSTSKGPKLVVTVPAGAQQPAPGLYASLSKLDTTLGAKSGKHKLIATTGCKGGKQPISFNLIYAVNPVSTAGHASVKGAASCKK